MSINARRRSSGYSVPCVYCAEGTSFPNLDSLKKHLISSHGSLVAGSRSGGLHDERNGKRLNDHIPSINSRQKHTAVDRVLYGVGSNTAPSVNAYNTSTAADRVLYGAASNAAPSLNLPVNSEAAVIHSTKDTGPHISERKFKRLIDTLKQKDTEIDELTNENDNLKSELSTKDEEQNQLRQRWRKEAEDAIRDLRTNYEDVLTQKQMLERQLNESENDKLRIRNENDKIVKDHADFQIVAASEKRNTQQRQYGGGRVVENNLSSEMAANNESLKMETQQLLAKVVDKDKVIQELQLSVQAAQYDLLNGRKKMQDIKGGFSLIQSEIHNKAQNNNLKNLSSKISSLETSKHELNQQLSTYQLKTEELSNEITSLKEEKNKLIENLQNADTAFNKLSNRISSTTITTQNKQSSAASYMNDQILTSSLDQILNAVKQISVRDSHWTKQEVNHLAKELHRVNLSLLEEKVNVKQLKSKLVEMETFTKTDEREESEKEAKKKFTEFEILRSKHQKCKNNEKILKQMKSEKKILRRKFVEEQKQLQLLNILFNSLQEEAKHKNDVMKDVQKERKLTDTENKRLTTIIEKIRQEISDRDIILEKYKRESCYLLEKLNSATEEVQVLKSKNDNLQSKVTNFDVIQTSVEQLQDKILVLNENNRGKIDLKTDIEPLVKNNIQLTNQIITLRQNLHDEENAVNKLSQKITEMENLRKTRDSDMEQLLSERKNRVPITSKDIPSSESIIENLLLEKEILSSRVLILEGIRAEMEILRVENSQLKGENLKFKESFRSKINKSSSSKDGNIKERFHSKLDYTDKMNSTVTLDLQDNQDFFESMKTLDNLCEEDKTKLKNMLSTPEFENFLSTSQVVIDLKYESSENSSIGSTAAASFKTLSNDRFESEHTVNHIYSAENSCAEIQSSLFESDEDGDDDQEQTIDYLPGKKENIPVKDLDKIFSESKLISNDIAIQSKQHNNVDYRKVLHEFEKVITQMSSSNQSLVDRTDSSASAKAKQVKFSDHIVEVYKSASKLVNEKSKDDGLYKSYFQDALQKNYPQFDKNDVSSDDNIHDESDDQCDSNNSCDSNTDAMNELLSKQTSGSNENINNNKRSTSREKQSPVSSNMENSQTSSSCVKQESKNENVSQPNESFNLMDNSFSIPTKEDIAARRFSSINKGGVGILPLINEDFTLDNVMSSFDPKTDVESINSLKCFRSNLSSGSSGITPYAAVSPRRFSTDSDRLFKGIGMLPLINEKGILRSLTAVQDTEAKQKVQQRLFSSLSGESSSGHFESDSDRHGGSSSDFSSLLFIENKPTSPINKSTKRLSIDSDHHSGYGSGSSSNMYNGSSYTSTPATHHSHYNDTLLKGLGVFPLRQAISAKHDAHQLDSDSKGKRDSAANALHVLKSFIKKADKINSPLDDRGRSGDVFNSLDDPTLSHLSEDTKDFNDALTITVTSDDNETENNADSVELFNTGSALKNTSIINDSLLFSNEVNAHSMQLNDRIPFTDTGNRYLSSTPGVPDTMENIVPLIASNLHRPVTLDFSDASFNDLGLFPNATSNANQS